MDYMGFPELDNSDGQSLRRYIEGTSWNQYHDERIVVTEMDRRIPRTPDTFSRDLDSESSLCIRKGNFKLM